MDASKPNSLHLRFARKAFYIYAFNSGISSLGVALATICDSAVVGNAFGETGLAITSVVLPIYILFDFLSFALGIGGSALVSTAFGLEDHQKARSVFAQTLTLALISSIAIAIAGGLFLDELVVLLGGGPLGEPCRRYVGAVILAAPVFVCAPVFSLMLCADGNPGRATWGVILSSLVNLVLDLVFIFGLGSGIEGAAWAMVIGQCCAVAVYLTHFLQKKYALRLRLSLPQRTQAAQILQGGAGTASSYAWQFLYMAAFNNLLSATSGEQGLAIFNLVFNISMLTSAISEGISLAVPSLAGTYLGERDRLSLECTLRLALRSALVSTLALTSLLLIFAAPVTWFFGLTDPELLKMGELAIRLYALAIPFSCLTAVLSACWQTLGHSNLALGVNLLRGCVFPLAAGIPLIQALHAQGTAPALLIGEFLGLLAALLLAQSSRKTSSADSILLLPPQEKDAKVYEDVLDRDFNRLPEIVEAVEEFCTQHEIDPGTAYFIQLTIEELAANIIQFGFQDQNPHFLAIKVARYGEDVYIRIRDDATDYNPFAPAQGAEELDLLGIELVRNRAKDFIYQRRLIFNNLLIVL